jgi:EAL and modified HD-GYP domain-containing signal transduction protein
LLSLMDAILGLPMIEVLRRVSVDRKIKLALLGETSPLLPVYQLVLALETADWVRCRSLSQQLKLEEAALAELYLESVKWARAVMQS